MNDLFRDPALLGLAAFAALAAGALAAWGEARRARLSALFASPRLAERLVPGAAGAARRRNTLLRAAALVLILVALAGPQWGVELREAKVKTSQAVIAVDISLSMLAEDVKPNRLERAKRTLSLVLDGLSGTRVGVVAFAGDAFTQCPMTTDLAAARSLIRRLEAGKLPRQGSSLARAVEHGAAMLARYPGRKAVVLVTDGEERGGDSAAAARAAAEAGVSLVVLGVGTPEGAPIPLKDPEGRTSGYKKDRAGQTVVSRLGESGLGQLAAATRGAYWRLSNDEAEVQGVLRALRETDASEAAVGGGTRYKNRYRFPLAAAVLLLFVELLLPEVPRPRRAAGKAAVAAVLLLGLLAAPGAAEPTEWSLWKGGRAWKQGDPGTALKHYQKREEDSARARFNAGAARYALGEHEGAETQFGALTEDLEGARTDGVRANDAYYNLGNALFRREKLPEAAEAYKRCLLHNPDDADCRHNLVLALRPQNQKQKDKEKEKDKPKDDKKDQPPPPDQRPQSGGMSREDAERILQAVSEREKENRKRQPIKGSEKEGAGQEDDW
ncbi:MAG: VWA domain-containing protein [Elusimicrobia bacterium]|nr:VWA domain-containing protein [Elusimicrobiota bacterium]